MDDRFWHERYAASELIWTAEPNRFLVTEVNGMAPGRALDVACGEGRNAVWLATQGWDVTGVDFSRAGLDKAHRLARLRHVTVEWVLADVTTYQPPPAAFDLVTVLYLQLPSEPLAAALANAQGALAPGGTLLVIGHDTTNRPARVASTTRCSTRRTNTMPGSSTAVLVPGRDHHGPHDDHPEANHGDDHRRPRPAEIVAPQHPSSPPPAAFPISLGLPCRAVERR